MLPLRTSCLTVCHAFGHTQGRGGWPRRQTRDVSRGGGGAVVTLVTKVPVKHSLLGEQAFTCWRLHCDLPHTSGDGSFSSASERYHTQHINTAVYSVWIRRPACDIHVADARVDPQVRVCAIANASMWIRLHTLHDIVQR